MKASLPSLQSQEFGANRIKPRILVLEVRHPERLTEKPVAMLLVERTETFSRDRGKNDEVREAFFRLSYEEILPQSFIRTRRHGEFDACYSAVAGQVKLTSHTLYSGAVFLGLDGLEGHRIGSYLMNEIVHWAQQWPEASVIPINLSPVQAVGDNTQRRNRFYEQFGLEFDYDDHGQQSGRSKPMLAKELNLVSNWKQNITEHEVFDYLGAVLHANEEAASNLAWQAREIERLRARVEHTEARPLRWALKTLVCRHTGLVGGVILLAFFGFSALSHLKGYL